MLYKLSLWQGRIVIFFTVLFMILAIIWFITDCNRLEPLTILFGGIASLANFIWYKPNYRNSRVKGRDSFNYSSNNGKFDIGKDKYLFTTQWSKASDVNIYLYNDPQNIKKIAIAKDVFNFAEIRNPEYFDFSSRCITLCEGDIAILVNQNDIYCLLKVIDIKDNSRSDKRDELTIEWLINPNGQKDFS
ncbi:TPA: hypothetical protein ACPDW7_000708 [Pasteurella multocida]|uniref:hypothetical protein n=1 Tax=Pasteurella multocida TaxID=747 RepID=UPI002878BB64|nr:hypothetical protein [Pasteurella multocida]HDR1024935.1 hypothetical protein [Pasteurella multocida]HDR1152101.1 hypothetical protein [Pasteurella multocida]HDR1159243.1 hypothetical protein [Pasteurella multocida]HDR1433508.1 hypothetical protein [Pasteurella multocida]